MEAKQTVKPKVERAWLQNWQREIEGVFLYSKLAELADSPELKRALQQMAEEGVVQVFRPLDGAPALVGVVGPLQLDDERPDGAAEQGRVGRGEVDEVGVVGGGAAQAAGAQRAAPAGEGRGGARRATPELLEPARALSRARRAPRGAGAWQRRSRARTSPA